MKRDTRTEIHSAIMTFTEDYGHPPSVREIMRLVGLASPNTIHYQTRQLIRTGLADSCPCGCGRVWAR